MFIITTEPEDILLLKDKRVEGIIWKPVLPEDLVEALKNFDMGRFKITRARIACEITASDITGNDHGVVRVTDAEKRQFTELRPVFDFRAHVANTLSKLFKEKIAPIPLELHPAGRGGPDKILHRDRAKGNKTKKDIAESKACAFLIAHNIAGTIAIPGEDAGEASPMGLGGRALYRHPLSMSRKVQAEPNDVIAIKQGAEGTVHCGPEHIDGHRLLSFFQGPRIS